MNTPADFYKTQIEENTLALKSIKKQLYLSSMLRLLFFIAVCAAVYFTFGNAKWVIAIIILGIVGFVFMVTRHNELQYKRDLKKQLIAINTTELEVLNRNFHHLPSGENFADSLHVYSQDIDLFGRGSFYQYLNRTALESGSVELARLLTENGIDNISEKQAAVKELSEIPLWRQRFSGIASLLKTEVDVKTVKEILDNYSSFVPKWIGRVSAAFTVISGALLTGWFMELLSGYYVFGWFLLGLVITGKYLKKINELSLKASKIQGTFQQYHKLLQEVEVNEFTSPLLAEMRVLVADRDHKASSILRSFAKHLDALDQRNNMLIGVLANGFLLRDLKVISQIEKWIDKHHSDVEHWFDVIAFFDAYNSLGNFNFNHPNYVFPEIIDGNSVLNVRGAGHPLLNPEGMVRNDLRIDKEKFFIITGANMAGKSTFLRTVALQIVMGNIGLPVCAEKSEYSPIKLITSMRTTDSLTDDESYFFSELKRLKFIVDQIKTDHYFIILDEILKGTNSTDKAIGSRKFVEKLVASNSTGVIATHDLSLCEASEKLSDVENYFFDARIENDELYFDYTFKPGICQNMNASFLLKKMQIID